MMTSLSLTITSPQKDSMGSQAIKTFNCNGGTIGRAPLNDWVLPEETVSSQHALVSFQDEEFFITDLSTNGVYINDSIEPLGNGRSTPLKDVYTLSMGRYSIAVNLETSQDSQETLVSATDDSFQRSTLSPENSCLDDSNNDPLDLLGSSTSSDPLSGMANLPEDLFGESNATPLNQDQQAFENAPNSAIQDAFIPPSTHTEPLASGSTIPDDWDQTCFRPAVKPETAQLAPEKTSESLNTPTQEFDIASQQTLFTQAADKGMPESLIASNQTQPVNADASSDTNQGTPVQAREFGNTASQYLQNPFKLAKAAFEQNGLDATLLDDPNLVDQSLALLPLMLEGMLATLRSRAEVKNELRASQTILQPVENNPLKFSTNAQDAFHNLLVNQRPGFLSPEESVKQAFEDLTRHEAALVLGIQTGLSGMLEKMSPDTIESKISHLESKKNLFGKISSSKKWAYYKETYQHITENSEHSFIDMFGDDFVKGYEAFISNQKKNGK